MPIPFAPRRTRQKGSADVVVDPPEYFDFDFRSRATALTNVATLQRPRTAGAGNSVRKQSAPERPRTAERPVVDHLTANGTDDSWIGLALGSPTHAPTGWMNSISPVSPQHAFRHEGPFPSHSLSAWKKIGGFFKAQSDTAKALPARPTLDGRTRHAPSQSQSQSQSPAQARARAQSHSQPQSQIQAQIQAQGPVQVVVPRTSLSEPRRSSAGPVELPGSSSASPVLAAEPDGSPTSSLPKLEIDIPVGDFDRYSVMFGAVFNSNASERPSRKGRVPPPLKQITMPSRREIEPTASALQWPARSTSLSLPRRSSRYQLHEPDDLTLNGDGNGDEDDNDDHVNEPEFDAESDAEVEVEVEADAKTDDADGVDDHSGLVMTATTEEDLIARLKARIVSVQKQATETEVLGQRNAGPTLAATTDDRSSPPPQAEEESVTHKHVGARPVVRSISGPGPRQRSHTLDSIRPQPLRRQQVQLREYLSSPEDGPSTDRDVAWRSTDSLQSTASSQTSAEEEIFFDMKPFRDSRGTRDSQYVITNPNAVAIEIARSVSLKNRKRLQNTGLSPDLVGYEWTPEMLHDPWAMPPDLQAAEHFCVSSDMQAVEPVLRLSMFDKAIDEVQKLALAAHHESTESQPRSRTTKTAAKRPARTRPRSRLLAVGIPSPITEKSFEETPQHSPRFEQAPRLQHAKRHIAHQTRASPTIIVSNLSSTYDLPPPVPRKDSKFLAKRKSAARAGDSRQPRAMTTTANRQTRPRQSATRQQHSARKPTGEEIAVRARPAAEVAVARTMSLSRKASHKIFVRRQDSHGQLRPQQYSQQGVVSTAR